MLKTLPISAGKEEIKGLVVEWLELLAQENYSEALKLILYDNTQEWIWTPENLEAAIFTYGLPWYTKEDLKREFGEDCKVDYKVTSILAHPDKEKLLEKIEIDFFDSTAAWGTTNIIGEVWCDCVLLDGERSDLTALFWIQKMDDKHITLLFRDLHVM